MKKFLSILLAVMMVLSTVSLAAPSLADVNDTVVEAAVDSLFEADEAADLAATTTIEEDTYGVLLWNLDFEDTTYPASGSVSNCGPVASYATTEPTLPEEFTGYYRIEMPTTATDYVEMNGSKVMPVYASGAYPFFGIASYSSSSNWTKGGTSMPCGYYTVVGDFAKAETNSAGSVRSRISNGGGKTAGTTVSLSTTMTTIAHDFKITESATTAGYYVFGASDDSTTYEYDTIQSIGTYFGTTTVGETYYVDNYKVYWKPLTVDVTVEAGDNAYATGVTLTDVANDGTVTVADLVADVESLNAKLVATGVVYNDKEYALTDSIGFGGDATVEVVWEEVSSEWYSDEYGTLVWVTNFDKANDGSSIATGDYTSVLNGSTENTKYNKLWSVLNPNYSVYSDVADEVLLSSNFNVSEVYYDETLGSNVFRGTSTSAQSFPQLNWLSRYGERANYDFFKDRDSVISVVNLYKNDTISSPTYRYNGYDTDIKTNNGGDKAQDSYEKLADLDNGWSKWVGVWSWPETNSDGTTCYFDAFKLHVNGTTTAGQYSYFDDIKMYVKPKTATLTVDNSEVGIANLVIEDYDTTGVDVSEIISQIERPYGYVLAGLSRTKGGEYIEGTAAIGGNTVLYADWVESDEKNWETDNGILLFDINFDDATSFTSGAYVSTLGKVNPYYAESNLSDKWTATISYMENTSITNGEFCGTVTNASKWPQIVIHANSSSSTNTFAGSGYYTVEADMYYEEKGDLSSIGITPHFMISGTSTQSSGYSETATDNNAGAYQSVSCTLDTTENEGLSKVILLWSKSATSSGPNIKFDNVRLYWKPATINITVEGGSNGNFETVTLENVSTDATVEDVINMLPGKVDDYGRITNLAKDYEKIGLENSIGAVTDVTLTAVWTPWNKLDGGQEFPTAGEYYGSKTQFASNGFGGENYVGSGGVVTKAFITMYNGKTDGAYGIYTLGGDLIYKQLTPNANDTYTHGTATVTDTYTVAAVPQGSNHRVIINTTLSADNAAEYAVVKYKFQNVPDLTSDFASGLGATVSDDGNSATFTLRDGSSGTYSNLVEYTGKYYVKTASGNYQYGGGQEFEAGSQASSSTDGVTVNLENYEDEWIYDLIPFTTTMQSEGVSQILIDRPNHFRDMITVWDYVMFVGGSTEEEIVDPDAEPEVSPYAPTTSNEASIREASPYGIRFKASMTYETDTNATDYGWVVARQTKIEEAGLGLTDLTLDQTAFSIAVGYGREESVDIKNFFEETDEYKYFTGVVYNIPEDMYDDVIVARPFVKVDGEVVYGNPIAKSIKEVLQALANA